MFYETLLALCNEKDVGPTNLVNMLGISTGNLSKWKAGGIPRGDTLLKIADFFGCSVDHLLGRPVSTSKQSHRLGELSNSMEQLNEEGQDKVVDYAADLVASGRYIKDDQLGVVQENA